MKQLLEKLKEAERKADAADREYENDPENEEKKRLLIWHITKNTRHLRRWQGR